MKTRLFTLVCVLFLSREAFAQTLLPGALLPALPQQFLNANGSPAANGRLCTQASGTNTALAVYSDPGLTMPLPNPIKLNAAGIATTNGTTQTAVYTSAASYRVTLYGPGNNGIGTCNGQSVGALIWQFDNIYDFAQLNGTGGSGGGGGSAHPCTTGADMAAKITAAYSTLPSSGGIIDCSNLITPQSLGTDPFTGMTIPATIIFPVVTSTSTVALNVPPNVTLLFPQGAILTNSNKTNISGRIDAGNWQIFSGSGQVCFGVSPVCNVANGFTKTAVPQWWGALGNGVILGTESGTTGCNGTGGTAILSCASANFTSADVGKNFDLAHAGASNCGQQYWAVTGSTFNCNLIGTISAVNSSTQVVLSTNLANTVTGEQFVYALSEAGFVQSALNSGVSTVNIVGTYGVVMGALPAIKVVLNSVSIIGNGATASRFLMIGPVAYSANKGDAFVIDNGSNNITFSGVGFIGTNELGELNTFGSTPDGLLICSGVPGGLSGLCNSNSGITNVRFVNTDFSYTWGIGLHLPGSGTSAGQQVNGTYVTNSSARFNSYDGMNLNGYDNTLLLGVVATNNGTGGFEGSNNGTLSIEASQFKFNRFLGISLGGFTNLQHGTSCQITGNDLSNNGNGFTTNTVGVGLSINDGTQDCSISGNTIHQNHQQGISLVSVIGTTQNLTITGNTISSNGLVGGSAVGIGISCGCVGVTISDNYVIDESTNTIVTGQRTSNVVTINTAFPHNMVTGNTVTIVGTTGAAFDGTWTITGVADGTHFTFAQTASNIGPLTGGFTTTNALGFIQTVGINPVSASNTQIINNVVQHNRTRNVEFGNGTYTNSLFQGNNFPNQFDNDLLLDSHFSPSLATLVVRIPDIQTTTANVCSTSGSLAATCTTVITHNLQATPNYTFCTLDNTPNAQSGIPLIVKTDTSTSATTATVTISAQTAAVAGNGTMRCRTNYAY